MYELTSKTSTSGPIRVFHDESAGTRVPGQGLVPGPVRHDHQPARAAGHQRLPAVLLDRYPVAAGSATAVQHGTSRGRRTLGSRPRWCVYTDVDLLLHLQLN